MLVPVLCSSDANILQMGLHDEELEALAARVRKIRAQAGHADIHPSAGYSQRLLAQDQYDRNGANVGS